MEEDEQHDVQRKKIINSLENKGINVVLTNAPKIDAILKMELLAKNILLIRVSTEELILFSRSLEVPAIYGAQLASGYVPPFFEAESIELDEDKNLTILRAPKSGVAATLIIGGADY